jgi:predicted ABC-type ATPase
MTSAGERPRLLIVAGPNGAGKTTVTERGLAHEWFGGCEYINPDTIARDEFGDWNSESAVRQAANVAQERRERAVREHRSLAFETVFSGFDKVEFLLAAQHEGFFVRLFFVGTEDPTINASRVARRVMQGGHDVPILKIISRYFKSIANCAAVAGDVDRLYLYDNSLDGIEPRLIARASNGKILRRYGPEPVWLEPILATLR